MDIFISYDISDQRFVDSLSSKLRENGYEPFVLNLQLKLGKNVLRGAAQALRNCEHAIVVLSQAYTQSKWLQRELNALVYIDQEKDDAFILPVLIEKDCEIPALIDDKPLADFTDVDVQDDFDRLLEIIQPQSRNVFVVMTFNNERLNNAYALRVRPLIEELGYNPLRIDENIHRDKAITEQILLYLEKSEIVLVDLTDERPNCYYEAGYAHALRKEMILTALKGSNVHFDLAGYPLIIWKDEDHLENELRRVFKLIEERKRLQAGKPVQPFKAPTGQRSPRPRGSAKERHE